MLRSFIVLLTILAAALAALGQQKAEVTISLSEAFFDAALEALFENNAPLEFAIAENRDRTSAPNLIGASYTEFTATTREKDCSETIRIQREINGVRTAVRFRDGKILAPLAFTGSYNPPFVGCVNFSGWAESAIDLEFDPNAQRLVARARVLNVNLSGTGGVGGTVIARMVQSSIDKKVNPIELFQLSKLTFALPVRGSDLQMRATGIRHELQNGAINVVIGYEFTR